MYTYTYVGENSKSLLAWGGPRFKYDCFGGHKLKRVRTTVLKRSKTNKPWPRLWNVLYIYLVLKTEDILYVNAVYTYNAFNLKKAPRPVSQLNEEWCSCLAQRQHKTRQGFIQESVKQIKKKKGKNKSYHKGLSVICSQCNNLYLNGYKANKTIVVLW